MVNELFQCFVPLVCCATLYSCSITAIFFDLFKNDKKYEIEVPKIPPPIIIKSKLSFNWF